MSERGGSRIQLCGRYVAIIDGSRVEDRLPGRRGRLLFAYLALHRGRPVPREDLLVAGWGDDVTAETGSALSVLLSKMRMGLGADRLRGRTEMELLLPAGTFVDAEAAQEGAHRAESAIAQGQWAQAWGPAGIAYHIATRPFLSAGRALDRRLAAPAGGCTTARTGVLRCRRTGPGRPGAAPGRGTRQNADRPRPLSRKRAPHPHRGNGATRQRRRGTPRLRTAADLASRRARDLTQPKPSSRSQSAVAQHQQLRPSYSNSAWASRSSRVTLSTSSGCRMRI